MPGWTAIERFFEDYELGEREPERRRTVDQADISQFAGLTLDFHPAHVDRTYADPRYGGRLVHGMLTFSLVTGLNVEYNLRAISYGYDKVRFPNPMRSGDTLIATAEVVELREHRKPEIGLVVKQYTGANQDGLVVFSCQHTLAVDRRAASAGA
jgi:acyl dehydratase